jgi:purine nucleoside phosphorylase
VSGAAERVLHAASLLRGALRGANPRVLLLSRFGLDFLDDDSGAAHERPIEPRPRERPIEIELLGRGLLRARVLQLGGIAAIAMEREEEPGDSPADEALPVLVAGQLGVRGALLLLAAGGLPGFANALAPVPGIFPIGDWIRLGDADPLRELDAAKLGARFPDLRGLSRTPELARAKELLAARGIAAAPAVAVARRGPSGASDAELEAARRLGGDVIVEGCAAEVVAARHQGLRFLALALVLDAAGEGPADPGRLAEAAGGLLPRLLALLPELARALDDPSGGASAEAAP